MQNMVKNDSFKVTFNWEAFNSSAPSAAASRFRILTRLVLAEIPLTCDECETLISEVKRCIVVILIPLTRALSAGLACKDHLCHSHPSIEDRAQPLDTGQELDILDLLNLVLFPAFFKAACFASSSTSFGNFDGCEGESSTKFFLFSFNIVVAVHKGD